MQSEEGSSRERDKQVPASYVQGTQKKMMGKVNVDESRDSMTLKEQLVA